MTPNINEILARPCNKACSVRGADMGRPNHIEGNAEKLHLQMVRFVDGDYDRGGAYWGRTTEALWCAFSPDNTQCDQSTMVFVRAKTREKAKAAVLYRLLNDSRDVTEEEEKNWGFFR